VTNPVLSDVVMAGKEVCSETLPPLLLENVEEEEAAYNRSYLCHPKLAYSSENVALVKLNLSNKEVKDKVFWRSPFYTCVYR
jgi:hypothetical protein